MRMNGCCSAPKVRVIKVGTFEAGIAGLDEMLQSSLGLRAGDKELQAILVEKARSFGNYIAPSAERQYADAFLRELRAYRKKMEKGSPDI